MKWADNNSDIALEDAWKQACWRSGTVVLKGRRIIHIDKDTPDLVAWVEGWCAAEDLRLDETTMKREVEQSVPFA